MSTTARSLPTAGAGYTIVTHVMAPSATSAGAEQTVATTGPFQRFLKGEPKALGTVQIMIGVVTVFFGIVITVYSNYLLITVLSGITIWGGLIYIITGSLTVAASNKLKKCLVTGSLVMNVITTITTGIAIIIFSLNLAYLPWFGHGCYDCGYYNTYLNMGLASGIAGVLLILTIFQFIISISISAFACKATCCTTPPVSVNINMLPNHAGGCSVVSPFPDYNNQQWMNAVSGATASSPPMESPPEYTEIKAPLDN